MRLRWVGDGTDRLSWRDLIVLIHYMDGTTNLATYLTGGESEWDTQSHMLAGMLDGINAIIWQNGGGKGAKPKPIPRPGSTRTAAPGGLPQSAEGNPFKDDESGTFRGVMTPLDELNEWLGWA